LIRLRPGTSGRPSEKIAHDFVSVIRTPSARPLLFSSPPTGKAAVGQCWLRAIEAEVEFSTGR
jgi:hypothetical protein